MVWKKLVFVLLVCTWAPSYGQDSSSVHEIDLLFAGDIMMHGPQIRGAEVVRDSLYDFNPSFEYVEPLIREADFTIGNLELTLPGKGPYSGYPRFRSPDDLAIALRAVGFDLLVTANNHSNDGNRRGVEETIKTLRSYHFYQTGTFLNETERSIFYPLIVYKGVFKLAFLNYTYGTNGLPTPAPTVVNLIDEEQIQKDLKEAKALEPDFIIVFMHWGAEYQINESKEQSDLAKKILQWGGDLIIGAHPHVVQPIKMEEVIRPDSSTHRGLVAYSLGNFISNQQKKLTDMGLMVGLKLKKDLLTNKVELADHHYLPVYRHIEISPEGKRKHRAIPVSYLEHNPPEKDFMSEYNYKKMLSTVKLIRNHLQKFDSKERIVSLPTELIGN